MEPVVVVHGGAWTIPNKLLDRTRKGVKDAARRAYQVVNEGGSALDAVEAAVNILEDNPVFDAGTGSVLNSAGKVEMDAVIMDGKSLRVGGVACVQNIAHPVSLARLVLEKTPHTLIVGTGANDFADEMGISTIPTDELVTDDARAELETFRNNFGAVRGLFSAREVTNASPNCDTVGAVVVDRHGNIAYATSTGGITGKRPGRVGDSPIVGAGGYADNEVGAISCTGHGESIAKVCLAHRIITSIKHGKGPQESAEEALKYMQRRVNGAGGVIVINNKGDIGRYFTTDRMAWAAVSKGVLHHGIELEEDIAEDVLITLESISLEKETNNNDYVIELEKDNNC